MPTCVLICLVFGGSPRIRPCGSSTCHGNKQDCFWRYHNLCSRPSLQVEFRCCFVVFGSDSICCNIPCDIGSDGYSVRSRSDEDSYKVIKEIPSQNSNVIPNSPSVSFRVDLYSRRLPITVSTSH